MATPATRAGRPRLDIADVVRQHRAELDKRKTLSLAQRRVLEAIAACRTAALGGHLDYCPSCGFEHPAYNSCRNRHCPKCLALAQERWITARGERILPLGHFHVVLTLPAELRPLARSYPRLLFDALLRCAAETLLELGHSRLGATIGVTTVLHTWARNLTFHPHVHAPVSAGGLSPDGTRFVRANPKYLFPVEVMGALLRGKMMAVLRRLKRRGQLAPSARQTSTASWLASRAPAGSSTPRGPSATHTTCSPISVVAPTASPSPTPGSSMSPTTT